MALVAGDALALANADGSGSTLVAVLDPRLHAATRSAQATYPQDDFFTAR
jgi:hypothetical protein